MVQEVTDVIKKTGAATESAIRDNTFATQTELQRLQVKQEISMMEMQLSSLEGEVRGLERAIQPNAPNPRISNQLSGLYFQEFRTVERLRNLRWNLSAFNSPDPENDPAALESQLMSIRYGIQALQKCERSQPGVYNTLRTQKALAEQFGNKLLQIKIKAVRKDLLSNGLTLQSATDLAAAATAISLIRKDILKLENSPRTPENTALLKELHQQQDGFYSQWHQFETQAVQANARSLDLPHPKDLNILAIQSNLAQIQNDIHALSSREENDVVRAYLKSLRSKEKTYQKALSKNAKTTVGVLGLGALFAGMGLALGKFWQSLFEEASTNSTSQESVALAPQLDTEPANELPGTL